MRNGLLRICIESFPPFGSKDTSFYRRSTIVEIFPGIAFYSFLRESKNDGRMRRKWKGNERMKKVLTRNCLPFEEHFLSLEAADHENRFLVSFFPPLIRFNCLTTKLSSSEIFLINSHSTLTRLSFTVIDRAIFLLCSQNFILRLRIILEWIMSRQCSAISFIFAFYILSIAKTSFARSIGEACHSSEG